MEQRLSIRKKNYFQDPIIAFVIFNELFKFLNFSFKISISWMKQTSDHDLVQPGINCLLQFPSFHVYGCYISNI